jgi:hypothetical protein
MRLSSRSGRQRSEPLGQHDLRVERYVRPASPRLATPLDVTIGGREADAHVSDHDALTGFEADRVAGSQRAGRFGAPHSSQEAAAPNRDRGTGRDPGISTPTS